jgi:hypothetical protein
VRFHSVEMIGGSGLHGLIVGETSIHRLGESFGQGSSKIGLIAFDGTMPRLHVRGAGVSEFRVECGNG